MEISPFLFLSAFLAGMLIFFAPCTVPLIPAYLAYISGVTEEEVRTHARGRVLRHAFAFVLGFGMVFMVFGLLAGAAGAWLAPVRDVFLRVGGVLVVVLGLFMLGIVRMPSLHRERKATSYVPLAPGNPLASFGLGALFAAGWTPCVGPVLATVLLLASSTETALTGASLLALFAAGFAVPFLLLGIAFEHVARVLTRVTPFLHIITRLGGGFLVLLGAVLVLGRLDIVGQWSYMLVEMLGYEHFILPYL